MFDRKGNLAKHAWVGSSPLRCMSQSYATSGKYHLIKSTFKEIKNLFEISGCISCNLLFVHVSHSSCHLFNIYND